jgi:hypothetical protein
MPFIFAEFFGKNIYKIITLVPGHPARKKVVELSRFFAQLSLAGRRERMWNKVPSWSLATTEV